MSPILVAFVHFPLYGFCVKYKVQFYMCLHKYLIIVGG